MDPAKLGGWSDQLWATEGSECRWESKGVLVPLRKTWNAASRCAVSGRGLLVEVMLARARTSCWLACQHVLDPCCCRPRRIIGRQAHTSKSTKSSPIEVASVGTRQCKPVKDLNRQAVANRRIPWYRPRRHEPILGYMTATTEGREGHHAAALDC